MAKVTSLAIIAFGLMAVAPLAQADPVPVERETTAEEMTVLGPKPQKWIPDPKLEQQYYDSLAQRFGPQPGPYGLTYLYGEQNPSDRRSWIISGARDIQSAHLFEIALMQRLPRVDDY